jgi:hypothetical protein
LWATDHPLKSERTQDVATKDVATKPSDDGFLGDMFWGLVAATLLGGMLVLAALFSVPG